MEILKESLADNGIASSLVDICQEKGENYWSFEGSFQRSGVHSLISYPAMMVPTLQGHLIDLIKDEISVNKILDPFVGSGTVLTESISRGIDFTGIDINPFAILACRVKSGSYFVSSLNQKYLSLTCRINKKRKRTFRDFPGVEKWFHQKTAVELEQIAQSIREESSLWARRVFWLALGRAVRQVSNSRLSTYKLHKRESEQLEQYRCAKDEFHKQCKSVLASMEEQYESHKSLDVICRGRYTAMVDTHIGDVCDVLSNSDKKFDLIMTSPPYGDNQTTIPYGQFSYLPLHWIDLSDIDENLDKSVIESTAAIDSKSLGGSLRQAIERSEYLADNYHSAKMILDKLEKKSNGLKRFSTFFFDLEKAIIKLCTATEDGGYHSWTVGNRRINNVPIPMNEILTEMLEANGVCSVATINREIKHKKMAFRNSIADTMSRETIVIAQKASTNE